MNPVKTFAEGVAAQIHEYLPQDYKNIRCRVQEKVTANGVVQIGIEFARPNSKADPIIYMESYYDEIKEGAEVYVVMQEIASDYIQHDRKSRYLDTGMLMDYEAVRDKIEPVLLNSMANRKGFLWMPHREIADLSLFYSVVLPEQEKGMRASMAIQNEHIKHWGVSEQDLYTQAISNMERREVGTLVSMNDTLRKMFSRERYEGRNLLNLDTGNMKLPTDIMYVLTNEKTIYGASLVAVPSVMEKVNQLFPDGYYILPSSVHEVMILPKPCDISAKELGEMVRDINRHEVCESEWLSNCVYEYDKEKCAVRQVPESVRHREMER